MLLEVTRRFGFRRLGELDNGTIRRITLQRLRAGMWLVIGPRRTGAG